MKTIEVSDNVYKMLTQFKNKWSDTPSGQISWSKVIRTLIAGYWKAHRNEF